MDTRYLYYSKMGPKEYLMKYWDRVDYIHFKDSNQGKYDEVLAKKIKFFDTCEEQVICPIGKGYIDYERLHVLLNDKLKYERVDHD